MTGIRKELIERIARLAEISEEGVRDDVPLRDLGVDSLMAMEIVAFVEKRLQIDIPEEEIPKVRTLADILATARRHAGEE